MKSLFFAILFFVSFPIHAQEITIAGTMHHTQLEGGCWYLKGDGGTSYELIGDSGIMKSIRIDGQHVVVRGTAAKGMASICMMGEIVRVLQRIDTVRYPTDLPVSNLMLTGKIYKTKSGIWYVKTASGMRYEYKEPPVEKYQHVGMSIRQKYRVLLDRNSTRENMDGVIEHDAVNLAPIAKKKTFDSR